MSEDIDWNQVALNGIKREGELAARVVEMADTARAAWNAALEEAARHFEAHDSVRYGWTADMKAIAQKLREMKK